MSGLFGNSAANRKIQYLFDLKKSPLKIWVVPKTFKVFENDDGLI